MCSCKALHLTHVIIVVAAYTYLKFVAVEFVSTRLAEYSHHTGGVFWQTQTERDGQGRADPEALSGFDNWNNIPPDIERFIIETGTMMVEELDKSDASQVT